MVICCGTWLSQSLRQSLPKTPNPSSCIVSNYGTMTNTFRVPKTQIKSQHKKRRKRFRTFFLVHILENGYTTGYLLFIVWLCYSTRKHSLSMTRRLGWGIGIVDGAYFSHTNQRHQYKLIKSSRDALKELTLHNSSARRHHTNTPLFIN